MATYYVDASHSTNGNGSAGNPWKRIGLATAASLSAGDVVRVKPGTYQEEVKIPAAQSGVTYIADNPATKPVIDGKYHVGLMNQEPSTSARMPDPTAGGYLGVDTLVSIAGNNVTFDGFVVQNSAGTGITPKASGITVQNCVVFFTHGTNIKINGAHANITIRNNRLLFASIMIFDPTRYTRNPQCAAQCVAGAMKIGNTVGQIILEGNEVAYGFGEGINLGKGSKTDFATAPNICQDNFVHDCNHVHIYCNGIQGVIVRRNVIFSSHVGAELNAWANGERPPAIRIMDEADKSLSDVHVYNNIIVNPGKLLQWGGRLTRSLNTFVGFNTWVPGPATVQGIYINAEQKGIFQNNIIGDMPAGVSISSGDNAGGDSAVTFKSNNWSVLPQAKFRGTGDVTGTPRMVNPNAQIRTTNYLTRAHTTYAASGVSHNFNVDNYRTTSSSPGLDKATARASGSTTTPPVEPFNKDYFQANRANPDLGAVEYGGVVPNSVSAGFSGTPRTGNAPLNVSFTDESTTTGAAAINSRSWNFGDGGTSTATNPSHNYAAPGTYTVTLTVQDTVRGLSDTLTRTTYITVGSPPAASVTAAFAGSPRSGAAALQVTFADLSTTTGGAVINSWLWELGDGTTSTERNPIHAYNQAGTYTVKLTAYDTVRGLSDAETKTNYITVSNPNAVTANFTPSATAGVVPLEVEFTDTSSETGAAAIDVWLWDFGDGNTSAEQNPSHVFAAPGLFTVRLTVTDTALGLSDSHTATVQVTQTPPDGGGDVVIRQTRAAAPTAGTTWPVTVAGLGGILPKLVRLEITKATTDGAAADGSMLGVGMATSEAAQWAWCVAADHGAADTAAARRERHNDTCLLAIDGSGAVLGRLSFNSWTVDGVVFNVDDPFPAGYLVTVRFFGGTDYQGWVSPLYAATSGSVVEVTAPGFLPDLLEAFATWSGHDEAAADATVSVGIAHRASGATQYMIDHYYPDGAASTTLSERLFTDQVLHYRYGPISDRAKVVIENFNAQGFNARVATNDIQQWCLMAAHRFGNSASGIALIDTPTGGTATDYLTTGNPQYVLHILSNVSATGNSNNIANAGVLGFHGVTADGEYSNTIASEVGATTTNEQSLSDNQVNVPSHTGSTLLAGSTSLGAAKYSLTMSTTNATARKWPVVWVQEGVAVGGEPIVADFTTNSARVGAAPMEVAFTDLSGGPVTSWLWDFGDGMTSTEQHPVHTYEVDGTFSVTLTVSDGTNEATATRANYIVVRAAAVARKVIGPIRLRDRDDLTVSQTHLDPETAERGFADVAWGRTHQMLWLVDGVATPDAREGAWGLFVGSDGTLKVKLPDGTVKVVNLT